MINFKAWLQLELKNKGKSQRSLAAFMGIRPAAITEISKGTRQLSAEEASLIANYLGCGVGKVLEMYSKKGAYINEPAGEKVITLYPGEYNEVPENEVPKKSMIKCQSFNESPSSTSDCGFNLRLYKQAVEAFEDYAKRRNLEFAEEYALGFIQNIYVLLKAGRKIDDNILGLAEDLLLK